MTKQEEAENSYACLIIFLEDLKKALEDKDLAKAKEAAYMVKTMAEDIEEL